MAAVVNFTRHVWKQQRYFNRLITVRSYSAGESLVKVTHNDATDVSTVTLQRSPVNALSLELMQQINEALDTLERNKSAGMILTSALPTVFSAGLDIVTLHQINKDDFKIYWTALQDLWLKLYGSSFPTVAAINGHSPAGGCLLALACEFRVQVGPNFTIGLNESRLGIVAPKWLRDAMTEVIGFRQSELALTTGKLFKVEDALSIGLIDEVATDKADAIKKAERFLSGMSRIPHEARSLTKKAVREKNLSWLANNQAEDCNVFFEHLSLPHVQQGIKMYLEMLQSKRK